MTTVTTRINNGQNKIVNSQSEVQDLISAQGLDTITDMQLGPDGYHFFLSYTGKMFKVIPKTTDK